MKTIKNSSLLTLLGCLAAGSAAAAIEFVDVSATAGISEFNETWGASWGDYDGDGDPDLWVSNHTFAPGFYANNGDGTFSRIPFSDPGDSHGAQWADLDNDGDMDLVEYAGSSGGFEQSPNKVYINNDGTLVESASALGLDLPLGRGRNPLVFDWNADGLSDVYYIALTRNDGLDGSGIFEQQNDGTFLRVPALFPADPLVDAPVWGQLTDTTGDGKPELATFNRLVDSPQSGEGWRVFDMTTTPFTELTVTNGPPQMFGIYDVAIYDFNGDLLPDQFLVRSGADGSDVVQQSSTEIEVRIHPADGGFGVDIETTGGAFFSIPTNWFWPTSDVFLGASGINPPALDFALDSTDPLFQGLPPFNPNTDRGIYIGYDVFNSEWVIRNSGGTSELNIVVVTDDPVTNIDSIGFTYPADTSLEDKLYSLGSDGIFTDVSTTAGLTNTPCVAVAGGDFDNDMDVDAYLVCVNTIDQASNILLENDGTGVFTAVPLAGGAEGSPEGRGDTVTTVDYDGDGFLDLFVTNGSGWPPYNLGPHQLYRNQGNTNHWLQLDLVGTHSARDATGARVIATTGGVSQLREHTGGMHNRTQDHQRIHFGLGTNTVVDEIQISWPSGLQQTLTNVSADQVLTVTEPAPGCDVESALPVYSNGLTVALSRALFINPADSMSTDTQLKLSITVPGVGTFQMIDIGGDGSINLPAGAQFDLAPLPILPVSAGFPPRGEYTVTCEMRAPGTGKLLGSDSVSFEVQDPAPLNFLTGSSVKSSEDAVSRRE